MGIEERQESSGRQTITIKLEYMYRLDYEGVGRWLWIDRGGFHMMLTAARNLSPACEWRIVREADGIVIAQSKGA